MISRSSKSVRRILGFSVSALTCSPSPGRTPPLPTLVVRATHQFSSTVKAANPHMTDTLSTSEPVLKVRSEGAVQIVTLNRPASLNAVNAELHGGLRAVWTRLADDADTRAVVLTGAGSAFSAGGDLNAILENSQDPSAPARVMARARALISEMLSFPLPVVVAVNGPAVGLGANLALMGDVIFIAEHAYIADTHVSIGLACGDGGAAIWPAYLGALQAKRYLLTGDRIDAESAVRMGLASEVYSGEDLLPHAIAFAQRLARQPARALSETKRAVNAHIELAFGAAFERAALAEEITMGGEEHAAVIRRLIERTNARRGA
jgi:enoyl-CoA hydratase